MYDANIIDTPIPARCQILGHQFFHIPWPKSMEIQRAIDRYLDRLVSIRVLAINHDR